MYAHADTSTHQLVSQNNALDVSAIIADDFDHDLPFILVSSPQLKPTINVLALLPPIANISIINCEVVDGHGIRAPPIFFS